MSTITDLHLEDESDPFVPVPVQITATEDFTDKEKYFKFKLPKAVATLAGQFMQVGIFGVGEAPISISSGPGRSDEMEMCVRNVGDVTGKMHELNAGDTLFMRGPFGNGYDLRKSEGQNMLFVAGGLGLAPCRSFILGVLNNRDLYKDVTILYGARTPDDLLFRADLDEWHGRKDCQLLVTVDKGTDKWAGHVGLITSLFRKVTVDPTNTSVFIIGPPVMFKFAVLEVLALGVPENRIYCSLERRMKCGVGLCGHCQIRETYVCQEGPIFTYQQVKLLREGI